MAGVSTFAQTRKRSPRQTFAVDLLSVLIHPAPRLILGVGERCCGSGGGCQSRTAGAGKGWMRCFQNSGPVRGEDPPAKCVEL